MSEESSYHPSPAEVTQREHKLHMVTVLNWACIVCVSVIIIGAGIGIALKMIGAFTPAWMHTTPINDGISDGVGVAIGSIGVAIAFRIMATAYQRMRAQYRGGSRH